MGDFVSGDFRREGMGAPGIGDSPAHLTASRPVPSFGCPYLANSRVFLRSTATRARRFRVCDTQNVIGSETGIPASGRPQGRLIAPLRGRVDCGLRREH